MSCCCSAGFTDSVPCWTTALAGFGDIDQLEVHAETYVSRFLLPWVEGVAVYVCGYLVLHYFATGTRCGRWTTRAWLLGNDCGEEVG